MAMELIRQLSIFYSVSPPMDARNRVGKRKQTIQGKKSMSAFVVNNLATDTTSTCMTLFYSVTGPEYRLSSSMYMLTQVTQPEP